MNSKNRIRRAQEKIPYVELIVLLISRYGVFAKTNQWSRIKISKLWLVIGKLTREKYAGMHADTDNEENNFWQKLSYGVLERHRRYIRKWHLYCLIYSVIVYFLIICISSGYTVKSFNFMGTKCHGWLTMDMFVKTLEFLDFKLKEIKIQCINVLLGS